MPERSDIVYFGAGPATLPTTVLESSAEVLLNYEKTGFGLAEHSHRSVHALKVLADTKARLTQFLDIPDNYGILFLQSGGSGQFAAVIYNMVGAWVQRRALQIDKDISVEGDLKPVVTERLKASTGELKRDYIITGAWSARAYREAIRLMGEEHVNIVTDARSVNGGKYGVIPPESTWNLSPGAAFVYYCDNETVNGVEFPIFPGRLDSPECLVVVDMSSNILSRRVDVSKYAIIFAGAQKNMGITGLTLAIVRKDLFCPRISPTLLRSLGLPVAPTVFDYANIHEHNSLYNTLPIFDVWVIGQVLAELVAKFPGDGLRGMESVADRKAKAVYDALDAYPSVYLVEPDKTVRSRMNICFRVLGEYGTEEEWLIGAEMSGLMGMRGHRNFGGVRISNYNAITEECIMRVVEYIKSYAEKQK